MGRAPCCSKVGLHRGPWTVREDSLLTNYIQLHGEGHWRSLPKNAGLLRCGKSCRLRWMNYLRPDIKRGNITPDEDDLIIRLHALLGNRWSLIAGRLPGRTDNEIKNYWNTHLSKKLRSQGTDPNTHKKLSEPQIKEPKKRRNKSKTTKKVEVEKKIHVHNPKPTRVSFLKSFSMLSRSNSFDWNNGCSSQDDKEYGGIEVACDPMSTYHVNNGNGVCFLIGEDHNQEQDDMVNGSGLEKLYDEYLQLLRTEEVEKDQLDSFAASLLI